MPNYASLMLKHFFKKYCIFNSFIFFLKTIFVITRSICYQFWIKNSGICFSSRSESLDGSRNLFSIQKISFDDCLRTALFCHFKHIVFFSKMFFLDFFLQRKRRLWQHAGTTTMVLVKNISSFDLLLDFRSYTRLSILDYTFDPRLDSRSFRHSFLNCLRPRF